MTRGVSLVIALLLCFGFGCGKQAGDPHSFEAYGLTQSAQYRDEVTQGIGLANAAISKSVGLHMEPGWNESSRKDRTGIPVYVVTGNRLALTDKIFVPQGERFILVNVDCLIELPTIFHEAGNSHSN